MLIELAKGDAYGAGFEYAPAPFVSEHNTLKAFVQNPQHPLIPGRYTDDTQMSIAVAEVMLSGLPWTKVVLADSFVNCFHRDPRAGYAGAFYQFLLTCKSGKDLLDRIRPQSDKSGGAMRSPVIGYYPCVDDVIERTSIQASITHDTPDGIAAAVASALMTHYFIHVKGPKAGLPEYLEKYVHGDWSIPWKGFVGAQGLLSVHAAVSAVVANNRASSLLEHCVAYTGDVDTVAAIALAGASCCDEYTQDLPIFLENDLENGKFGKEYIHRLDSALAHKFIQ